MVTDPEAALFPDRAGKLPLHYAAEYNSCEPEVFQAILEANPAAARHKNKWGQLPIHYATWRRAPPELIRMLHEAFPVQFFSHFSRISLSFLSHLLSISTGGRGTSGHARAGPARRAWVRCRAPDTQLEPGRVGIGGDGDDGGD